MLRYLIVFVFISTSAFAEAFDRPIPQAQSATSEFWFALASLLLCFALYLVHVLVARR